MLKSSKENSKKLLITKRKRQLKILGHLLEKESLENLTLKRHIAGKRNRSTARNLLDKFVQMDSKTSATKSKRRS